MKMDDRVILAVEDSDAEFYVIRLALQQAGIAIQVCRAHDGDDAIEFLERTGPHKGAPIPKLVFLNINMPRRNGFEVLEYMKAHELLRSIPVVMFTTSTDATERQKALALGAEEFLTKPSDLDGLIAALSGVCTRFLYASHGRPSDNEGRHPEQSGSRSKGASAT